MRHGKEVFRTTEEGVMNIHFDLSPVLQARAARAARALEKRSVEAWCQSLGLASASQEMQRVNDIHVEAN